jgi:hypothetical protein
MDSEGTYKQTDNGLKDICAERMMRGGKLSVPHFKSDSEQHSWGEAIFLCLLSVNPL